MADTKRALAREVEELYNRKEKETLQEGEQLVRKGGLSKAVRKAMGRGVTWADEWEEEEELVVRELGRSMVTEQWSMGEGALVKERRVTSRESTTFACVSKHTIALEHIQLQPFSS